MTRALAVAALVIASCAPPAMPHAAARGGSAHVALAGARLVGLDAHGDVYGPLAFTRLRFAFDAERAGETTFEIALPADASIAELEVGGHAAAFEALGAPPSEDALVFADGRLRVRVAVPRGRVDVVVGYEEALLGEYRLPLAGYPRLARLDASVTSGPRTVAVHTHDEAADDVVAGRGDPGPSRADAVRGGDFAVVRFAEAPSDARLEDVAVLFDTSASMVSAGGAIAKAAALLERANVHPRIVAAFDQEVVALKTIADAKARHPAGATDIGGALSWAVKHGATRAIVVTDGQTTLGSMLARENVDHFGLARVDVVAARPDAELATGARIGTEQRDLAALHRVAASGARPGAIIDLDGPLDAGVAALAAPVGVIARAEVSGAVRAYPTALSKTGALASEALAFVELPADGGGCHCNAPLLVALDGATPHPLGRVATAPAWLVERAVAEAKIRELGREPAKNAAAIVALAVRHRILTPLTALRASGVLDVTSSPDADRDHDGIPDSADKCPLEPETPNGYEDDDGCPDRGQVISDSSHDYILQQVFFRTGLSRIELEAKPLIDATAEMLQHHPGFELIATFGNSADNEPAALADARARAVRDALVARGIAPNRVIAKGFGATRPYAEGTSGDARARNRRVEFRVLIEDDIGAGTEDMLDVPGLIRRGKALPTHPPLSEPLRGILDNVVQNRSSAAQAAIDSWLDRDPSDPRPWLALGAVHPEDNARAYGSLLDFASTVESLRAAAGLLESAHAFDLAVTAYDKALVVRANDPRTRRLRAWALARAGTLEDAFAEILDVNAHPDPIAPAILVRDVGLIAAMYARGKPVAEHAAIFDRAKAAGAVGLDVPSTFAVLTWETRRSDLDVVAVGPRPGDVAFAENDVTDGYGPEVIALDEQRGTLEVHLIARGSAPVTIAKLTTFVHDGRGIVTVRDNPVVMENTRSKVTF